MAYIVRADLAADLPDSFLAQALNDGPGGPITFDVLALRASERVDAILVQRVVVPIAANDPGRLIAKEAARIFALESAYKRRGYHGEANPWSEPATMQARKLESIVKKDQPFAASPTGRKPSATVIATDAKTHSNFLSV